MAACPGEQLLCVSVSALPVRCVGFADGARPARRARSHKAGDRRSCRIKVYRAVVLTATEEQTDITLVETFEMLHAGHAASFAAGTTWRFLDRPS